MRYKQFEDLVTLKRLNKYVTACNNNTSRSMRLYRANIRLSKEFLAILGIFEVVLRNKIDNHYKSLFPVTAPDHEWLLQFVLPGGRFANNDCRNTVKTVVDSYTSLEHTYSHDKLIASLSFGVWKYMFAGKQYQNAGNTLLTIFPNRPLRTSQKDIYSKLNKINAIRNRVAHHEPICFDPNGAISTHYARQHYVEVIELVL